MSTVLTGGEFKGHKILTLKNSNVARPSSSKLREALFNVLGDISGNSFLDLFAGYGTVGLEALSRGAEKVDFVESNSKIYSVLQKNVRKFSPQGSHTYKQKAELFEINRKKYDVVFLDPPFTENFEDYSKWQKKLKEISNCLVVQFPSRNVPDWVTEADKIKKYGESSLAFFYN